MNLFAKNVRLWLVVVIIAFLLWNLFQVSASPEQKIIFSQFLDEVEHGRVAKVVIEGDKIKGTYIDGKTRFHTVSPSNYNGLVPLLRKHHVEIEAKELSQSPWLAALLSWAPMVVLIIIWIFFMRQMQAGGNKALSFGKSRARLAPSNRRRVTFKDVAGVDEALEELREIIDFLKNPKKFQRLGGRIPKGVLLMGPPGTGKTLLARAIAGEANVPFFSICGSDFVEMFVGVGASRVRDLFEQGKKNAPCIIFIDEIDAVGRHRGAGLGGGHDEREQTLNQLLAEMDGFESNEGVILIAATNRPDILDPALLRPGRFDRRIVVDRPDVKGREAILKVHTRRIPLASDVDLSVLARGTPGFSGADLENLVNEAALLAARRDRDKVMMEDFEEAKDKVLMGVERKSMIITEVEKKNTAYHEAGHALLAMLLPKTDPLHKVSIIPRGTALGVTQQLPIDDRHTYTKEYLEDQLCVLLGGRASEEIFLKDLTTGAGNDLERATKLARRMVCEWGMSDQLGPLTFGRKDEHIFLGKEFAHPKEYSERTAELIDEEVKRIVTTNYERAKKLILDHKKVLERIAEALLEREVLTAEEIKLILEGKPLAEKAKPVAQGEKATEKEKKTKPKKHPVVGESFAG
ncbi:MAG: ATP-dependent zinc metalloprotease FtsH [Acidobacteria bacterium]|nr:ATP-dependent zinc metalloprotease FtsH [Acidobacteriota bacterium]